MFFKYLRERSQSVSVEEENIALLTRQFAESGAWAELGDAIRREFAEIRTFYLTGAGRSGTTSCARILGAAENAKTVTEPAPNLAMAVRAYRLGHLADPRPAIWTNRIDGMRRVLRDHRFYGEKDLKGFCWLPFYRELFNPRFVLVLRDGRETVASLLDWHCAVHGNLYLEAGDDERLAPEAAARRAERPREEDLTELGRPRPTPDDPAYEAWKTMTRREMLAWYWGHVTRVAQRDLYRMEDDRWTTIDYSRGLDAGAFARLYDFLELEGFDADRTESMLAERINSFSEKAASTARGLGPWTGWTDEEMAAFDRHAAAAMVEVGYYGLDRLPSPEIPASRRDAPVPPRAEPLSPRTRSDLAEILGSGGSSPARAQAARVLLIGGRESDLPGAMTGAVTVWSGGAIDMMPEGPFDLVCALGVIDSGPDMDRFLVEAARRTTDRLVVTACRGHFPLLIDHRYDWSAGDAPRHRWCVARSRSLLSRHLGFTRVRSGAIGSDEPARPELTYLCGER